MNDDRKLGHSLMWRDAKNPGPTAQAYTILARLEIIETQLLRAEWQRCVGILGVIRRGPSVRVMIVDDEYLGRRRIRECIATEEDVDIVAVCSDGGEAISALLELEPDLVVLDIEMPEITGFDVIDFIGPERMPFIIFVSAFEQYAIAAFESNAVDYVLKPFTDDRLKKALARVRARLAAHERPDGAVNEKIIEEQPTYSTRLIARTGSRYEVIKASEVDWFEAADNYVVLHTGANTHLIRSTISGLARRLDRSQFVRIHRSVIVNLDRVKSVQPHNKTDFLITLSNGISLRSGRTYRSDVARLLVRLK